MPRRRLAPAIAKHHFRLKSQELHHRSKLIEHKEGLRQVREQLSQLTPKTEKKE